MDFSSDNAVGALPEILQVLARVNDGTMPSYGDDPISMRLHERMSAFFGREVAAFPVITGTAANALALATFCPPHGAVFCHVGSHIAVDECGAPEFFTHGAKLVELQGRNGKLTPDVIAAALPDFQRGVHGARPTLVSITQASEVGTAYSAVEIATIAETAHANGMFMHMDGARFANALVYLDCAPADITWKAGVDVLSFGATKNGALGAEAVVFFDPANARDFEYRRKKAGHLLSKMRFVSAQLEAYLENDRWREPAAHANAFAKKLETGLVSVKGAEIAYPVEANMVLVRLPDETVARLRKAGASFYDWAAPQGGRTLIRLVCSFATSENDTERFLDVARG